MANSTGANDQEEISKLSDTLTENPAVSGSPTDNTIMHGVTEKAARFSSFLERVKNTLGNLFPSTLGMGAIQQKIFEILLNRFGSGVQGYQVMMRFEKRRQREEKTKDKFLDDLEMLRRRSQHDESTAG